MGVPRRRCLKIIACRRFEIYSVHGPLLEKKSNTGGELMKFFNRYAAFIRADLEYSGTRPKWGFLELNTRWLGLRLPEDQVQQIIALLCRWPGVTVITGGWDKGGWPCEVRAHRIPVENFREVCDQVWQILSQDATSWRWSSIKPPDERSSTGLSVSVVGAAKDSRDEESGDFTRCRLTAVAGAPHCRTALLGRAPG